ncbi:MAG: substrate-binding domain-containing protein, partial [Protaetiibacter sp.]
LDVPSAAARLRGFRDALARGGQAFVPVAEGSFTLESGHHAMDELLERHPGIDGVFVSNDLMALGALHALHARGIRVPEEVAVIGFDDSTVATLARPSLTTVRQPIEDMAERMVAMLLEQLANGDARPSSVVFDPALVIRDSA